MESLFQSMQDFKKAFEEQLEREKQYLQMDTSALSALDESELYEAVRVRIDNKMFSSQNTGEEGLQLNTDEIVFYAVYTLDMEVNNGGLCQFFVNAGHILAPIVGPCLAVIGAEAHKTLYESFIDKYQIDVNDLSSFMAETVSDYIKQTQRYPFEEYDKAFVQLRPVQEYLIPYIKAHIEAF